MFSGGIIVSLLSTPLLDKLGATFSLVLGGVLGGVASIWILVGEGPSFKRCGH